MYLDHLAFSDVVGKLRELAQARVTSSASQQQLSLPYDSTMDDDGGIEHAPS